MITIFNRKELLTTFSSVEQADFRSALSGSGIPYRIKTVNRRSPSPFASGTRARTGSFGESQDLAYQYYIYVKKEDYEKAKWQIEQCRTRR